MCKWRSSIDPRYKCPHKAVPNSPDGYCLLHMDETGIMAEKKLLLDQYLSDAADDFIDLRGIRVPGSLTISREDIPNTLTIDPSLLGNTLRSLCLDEARIEGAILLGGLKLTGELSLAEAVLLRFADLSDCVVGGALVMEGAEIGGGVYLDRIHVQGQLLMAGMQVTGTLSLCEAHVDGLACLSAIGVHGSEEAATPILGNASFRHARFRGGIQFVGSHIQDEVDFDRATSAGVQLGLAEPGIPPMDALSDPLYPSLGTLPSSYASFWAFASEAYRSDRAHRLGSAAHYWHRVWVQTPRNHDNGGKSDLESHAAYVGRRVFDFVAWLFECLFLRWPTAYGSRFRRLIVIWSAVIALFALGYYFPVLFGRSSLLYETAFLGIRLSVSSFWRCLYFSAVTFTTLGLGEIMPTSGMGSLLASLEAIAGNLMLAMMILVIGRRYLR